MFKPLSIVLLGKSLAPSLPHTLSVVVSICASRMPHTMCSLSKSREIKLKVILPMVSVALGKMFSHSDIPSFRSKYSLINIMTPRQRLNEQIIFKTASLQQASLCWSVFKCYTALEVLLKLFNDQYSGKEDFGWGLDSNSGEEETDYNQHHPLVSDLVADDNGYITFKPPAGSENGDGNRNCWAGAINEHCTPSFCEEVRERSGRAGEGGGRLTDVQHWEEGVVLYLSVPVAVKNITPNI